MTDREFQAAKAISGAPNGVMSTVAVGRKLGHRGNAAPLAATSTLRAMERKGWVGRIPPQDRWYKPRWFLTAQGKAALAEMLGAAASDTPATA